jgi:predicted acetyltransferase
MIEVRPLDGERELFALSVILGWSFGVAAAEGPPWLAKGGHDNVRVAVDAGQVVGGLLHIPMGQWFGGRSVGTLGVAGVCAAAHLRGRGVARRLMQASLVEACERGIPLSTLYPATQPLYRGTGYEQAGCRFEYRARLADLPRSGHELELRRIEPSDRAGVEEAYRVLAATQPGFLDRGPYVWDRVTTRRGEAALGYLAEADGRVEGYLYVVQQRTERNRYDFELSDVVALTPRAANCVLGFLHDQRSLGDFATWWGGASDTLALAMTEQAYAMRLVDHWMLRICDVEAALTARGYPPGLELELELDVRDPLLAKNNGRFVLSIAGGSARVERGGAGALDIDVRGLGALYSGFAPAQALARAGLVAGSEAALHAATAAFAGAAPAMPDTF